MRAGHQQAIAEQTANRCIIFSADLLSSDLSNPGRPSPCGAAAAARNFRR